MENLLEKADIINKVIKKLEAVTYLEIGIGDKSNFNKIECENKLAVDPNVTGEDIVSVESDKFFDDFQGGELDVVFIDGNHESGQVRKDIINALKCNPKAILIHDTIPHSKEMQEVPRIQKEWTGDVWRAVVGFIEKHPDVKVETYRSDYGLTVIYPNGVRTRKYFENLKMTYEEFKENEVNLLNIID